MKKLNLKTKGVSTELEVNFASAYPSKLSPDAKQPWYKRRSESSNIEDVNYRSNRNFQVLADIEKEIQESPIYKYYETDTSTPSPSSPQIPKLKTRLKNHFKSQSDVNLTDVTSSSPTREYTSSPERLFEFSEKKTSRISQSSLLEDPDLKITDKDMAVYPNNIETIMSFKF